MNRSDYAIHWFRRDLRVAGNQSLRYLHKKFDGRVIGLFCFDKVFLSRPDFSVNRFQFFLNTLAALQQELRDIGSDLLVLDTGPVEAYSLLFEKLEQSKIPLPKMIGFSRDYEPFAVARDKKMRELFGERGIGVHTFRDHLLIEPHELAKADGSGYQVYSPFAKLWLKLFDTPEITKRVEQQKKAFEYLENFQVGQKIFALSWADIFKGEHALADHLHHYAVENQKKTTIEIPNGGTATALKSLDEFADRIDSYADQRDFPATVGTSKLSMFLKNGSITVPMIIARFQLKSYAKKNSGRDVFLSELIWREFYYHVLFRNPSVEHLEFVEKYRNLKWENREDWFVAWKAGKTGFPIVDAGMRELKQTGWMHNRVRMIVASFLTKDLLIDWRWGEKYFMEELLDGDLAPNNGGWQWAASTGCDPQPYFRIFNPWLQGKKFDPEGKYIKTYIPELADLPAKQLHQPILGHAMYPEPIVDHKVQRERALALYKVN